MAIGTAAAIIGGSVLGGALSAAGSSKAASTAARAQEQVAQTSAAAQERMFQKQVELQEPWRQAGINALAQIRGGFTGKVDLAQDPGYAFRLAEGQKALERSAAARGGLLSGATLRGTQRFGQELASQEYQNAYNRALTQYNTLANLAGIGQTTASGMASQAGQLGSNLGNLYYGAGTGAGQARASGYLGQANALAQMLGQGAMGYGLYKGGYFNPPPSPPPAVGASSVPFSVGP